MKAVTITEATKQLGTIGEIFIGNPPQDFNRLGQAEIGYNKRTDLLDADGWKEVIQPPLEENEKYGELIENANDFTYEVKVLSTPEVETKLKNQARNDKEVILDNLVKKKEEEAIQTITDDTEALAIKSAYPLWEDFPDGHVFEMPFKVLEFDSGEGDMVLYNLIQGHTKNVTNTTDVPALWNKIIISGGAVVWTQPIGGSGTYPYLDPNTNEPFEMTHSGETWENRQDTGLNTNEPGTVSSGWMQISNTPAPWYSIGAAGYPLNWTVTHNGNTWQNDNAGNSFEPGVWGWTHL